MKNMSGCMRLGAILVLLVSIVAALSISTFIYFDYSARQKTKFLQQYSPPTVLVTDPVSNVSAAAGSYLPVSATAIGMRPIVHVELWLDGKLTDTQNNDKQDGRTPFYADFAVLIPSEGPHMAFIRAVDSTGLIGQSSPISMTGVPKPANPQLVVTTEGGQTLNKIANAYHTTPETLQGLNPGLENNPATGTSIKVPLQPKGGPPTGSPAAQPANPPVEIPNVPVLTVSGLQIVNPFGIKVPQSNNPPVAPTGLQAEFKDCKIILSWNDNADNEDKYNVYLTSADYENYKQTLLVASLGPSPKTGPAWYEFETGIIGAVSLWVEAANSAGASPSNIAWIYAPYVSGCPNNAWMSDLLVVNLLDISVSGNYNGVYCYISLENQPEQRVPHYDGQFVQLVGGKGQNFYVGPFSLHPPSDLALDLSGKCLGWDGSAPHELGSFSANFPLAKWNGQRQTLTGNNFEIGLSLTACERGSGTCPYEYSPTGTDPTLPMPYNVREDSPDNPNVGPHTRKLSWNWDGDLNKIDAFQFYLNGQPNGQIIMKELPYRTGSGFWYYVEQPRECGATIQWQVAAQKGTALSALSAPFKYDLPACDQWLEVNFNSIELAPPAGAYSPLITTCLDTFDSYFTISVGNLRHDFYGGGFYRPLSCGTHSFADLIGDWYNPAWVHPDEILNFVTQNDFYWYWGGNGHLVGLPVHAIFMNHNDWSSDDVIGDLTEYIYPPSRQKDGRYSECGQSVDSGNDIRGVGEFSFSFTYTFYPNKCADTPPDLKDYYRHP